MSSEANPGCCDACDARHHHPTAQKPAKGGGTPGFPDPLGFNRQARVHAQKPIQLATRSSERGATTRCIHLGLPGLSAKLTTNAAMRGDRKVGCAPERESQAFCPMPGGSGGAPRYGVGTVRYLEDERGKWWCWQQQPRQSGKEAGSRESRND